MDQTWETLYGRVRILAQRRDRGGFSLEFADSVTGEILENTSTEEPDVDKAKLLAQNKAQDLLAKP